MEPFVNFVIRPPRAEYSVDDLLESEFTIKGRKFQRKDIEIRNSRGHALQCSHYLPLDLSEDTQLPCVIYCHGNSGCRADGNEAAFVLLSSNITVFTLDFAGSGLSDGDYVSLGWNERDDLRVVLAYLRSLKQTSRIGLWGRSMGAVTSLLYGSEDPSIAGMVLDSPFSSLFDLMMELVDVYKIRLPKFTIRVALQIMRRIIQKRAQFDIMDLNVSQVASRTFIPAFFGHGSEDTFILPHHSYRIYQEYAGDKNIIKFDGDHNSPRPQFYYDSVAIFFLNVLCPPVQISDGDVSDSVNHGQPGVLQMHEDLIEHVVSESLSEPVFTKLELCNAEEKLLQLSKLCENQSLNGSFEHHMGIMELLKRMKYNSDNAEHFLDSLSETRGGEQTQDWCSYPSSNGTSTKSWGRCSSQGRSENLEVSPPHQNFAKTQQNLDDEEMTLMKAIAVSLDDDGASAHASGKVHELQHCSIVTTRRRYKFDLLNRRFKLAFFKGMVKRSNRTS